MDVRRSLAVLTLLGLATMSNPLIAAAQGEPTRSSQAPVVPAGWYLFLPKNVSAPGAIGLADWLEKPAGKSGRVVVVGDQLQQGGKPIKLWGLNLCFSAAAPDKPTADRQALFYAKYGINAVRLHKYADGPGWAGIQSKSSFAEFDAAALDRFDYLVAALKKQGIFVKLSPTFGVSLGQGDKSAVPYWAEFGQISGEDGRVGTKHGAIYLSRELQDLQIAQMVRLLNHRNPHTNLTYATDPAVAVIELFNEDSALFFGTMGQLQNSPTLRKRAGEMFSGWLRKKYTTEENLLAAWGPESLNSFINEKLTGESWEGNTIVPAGNPWFYDPTQLEGSQKPKKARLLDTMQFLQELQNDFYDRYAAAIRATGYSGAILSSNWQAGRAFSHFHNLASDARFDLIDRHNYFGGGENNNFNSSSMLTVPGSGMLSSGMQQVAGKPFMLSEWVHVRPSEWGAEGVALISAYGMGLSGWDASFLFQNRDDGRVTSNIGRDAWDATAPQIIGLFPAVARQVYRNDIAQSELVISRNVHLPSLSLGKLDFEDLADQSGDVKSFGNAAQLAVGRPVVTFTATHTPTPAFDVSEYTQGTTLVSSTGQLRWTPGTSARSGFFTINTPGTQALVGFAGGQTVVLGDATIASTAPFAAIYLTALGRSDTLSTAPSVLITAMSRARNIDATWNAEGTQLQSPGKGPVILESVPARVTFKRTPTRVELLDHDGVPTGKTLTPKDNGVDLDGVRTPYVLVRF